MTTEKVDVAVNVLGKPYQTTLTLVSLLAASRAHIDVIYLIEERANTERQSAGLQFIKGKLAGKLAGKLQVYRPKHFYWIHMKETEPGEAEDVRFAVRYQYAWERSDKRTLFITHNDCLYKADVVGAMLSALGDHAAVGDVGACQGCPAWYAGKCSGDRYALYKPDLNELRRLYADHNFHAGSYAAPFHITDFCERYRRDPWPLPPCRVNEWSCLINLEKTRPLTLPVGSAPYFGAVTQCGECGLDIGAEWFHDMHRQGLTAGHMNLDGLVEHSFGHPAMLDAEVYAAGEKRARTILRRDFGLDFEV